MADPVKLEVLDEVTVDKKVKARKYFHPFPYSSIRPNMSRRLSRRLAAGF